MTNSSLPSAHDVARYLRHRRPGLGTVQLHKLLYYCQGWHLAIVGRPLFRERIEAWANGPVVASLWHDEDKGGSLPPPTELSAEAVEVVDFVARKYGDLSSHDLIRLTHHESPWQDVSEADVYNGEISRDALKRFFTAEAESSGLTERDRRLRAITRSRPLPPAGEDEYDSLRRRLESA